MKYGLVAFFCFGLLAAIGIRSAHAGFFSDVRHFVTVSGQTNTPDSPSSLQMSVLRAPLNANANLVLGTTTHSADAHSVSFSTTTIQKSVPLATTLPATYVVVSGDSLSTIAQKFGISLSSLLKANNLTSKSIIKLGQTLSLPKPGNQANTQVKDSVSYSASATPASPAPSPVEQIPPAPLLLASSVQKILSSDSYYMRPIIGGTKTQGIHGHNAVDLAESCGTPIYASATGTVAIADHTGWNGGYGNYVEINHTNNTQTLYAHMQTIMVTIGQAIAQGQEIGTIGHTGDVDKEGGTGCHVHFEIHNNSYPNPF